MSRAVKLLSALLVFAGLFVTMRALAQNYPLGAADLGIATAEAARR